MPDMQTALTKALNQSPLKQKPLNERIWLWLQDHPRSSAKTLATTLKEKRGMVQCNLTNMKNRGMVFNTPSDLRGARSTDVLWTVSPTMHGKFELLTLPKKDKKATLVNVPVTVKGAPQPEVYKRPEIDVELLTLKEAKRLYEKLKEFFG